jgi:DNA-binding transcriptional ArsR family regulator
MRVDVFDGSGNRYTITFEGNVTRDKAIRLLEIVELLGGMPENANLASSRIRELSKFDKVKLAVEKHFPIVWFTCKDVKGIYEQEFRELISLSTVSTYLSRMTQRGIITENKISNHKRYKILTGISGDALQIIKSNK